MLGPARAAGDCADGSDHPDDDRGERPRQHDCGAEECPEPHRFVQRQGESQPERVLTGADVDPESLFLQITALGEAEPLAV